MNTIVCVCVFPGFQLWFFVFGICSLVNWLCNIVRIVCLCVTVRPHSYRVYPGIGARCSVTLCSMSRDGRSVDGWMDGGRCVMVNHEEHVILEGR